MAVSMPRKKSKKSKVVEEEEVVVEHRCIPVTLVLLVILFLWSSSTTLISGSMVHVCVSSRKLSNNLYCFTAGSEPTNNSNIPNSLINNNSYTSKFSQITQKNPVFHQSLPTPASVLRETIDIQQTVTPKVINTLENPVYEEKTEDGESPFSFTKVVIRKGIDKAKAEEISNGRKDVEGQLTVLRSYIAKSTPSSSSCRGRGIYVYDLPSKFNKDLLDQCGEMTTGVDFCNYLKNNGMGEPIPELGKDWYDSHQYALEPIFHSRILKHPCRVHNVEDAKLFYVPFYGGLDILRWHFKDVPTDVKDSLSKEIVKWLNLQEPWKRNSGLDHVFVLGKISWDFRRWEKVTWGTRLLEFPELQNPMKLLIERQPWHINDVGIPHPTFFHPSNDSDIISWQMKIRDVRRPHLISFAGATRNASESIRSILIQQCLSAKSISVCNFLDCKELACVKSAPVVRLFTESEFCLQPQGDSPTRKSLFDSLVAGCIPVVFDPFTAYYQYPWHLPGDYRKYSVYIDQEEVREKEVNVVERLAKIPLKKRQEMRRYIIDELMPRLVYSHPDGKLEKFQDAFSIAVNNLLERAVRKLP